MYLAEGEHAIFRLVIPDQMRSRYVSDGRMAFRRRHGLSRCSGGKGFVAGMTVGVGRLFPLREQVATFQGLFDYVFIMQKHEYSLLVIGIGIMLFHTFQRDY